MIKFITICLWTNIVCKICAVFPLKKKNWALFVKKWAHTKYLLLATFDLLNSYCSTQSLLTPVLIWRAPTPASEEMSAFLWDWSTNSSCPPSATTPPKNWALSLPRRPKKRQESSKGWGSGTFAGLLFSNLMSLLLGAGLGVWIYRRCSQNLSFVISALILLQQWQMYAD